MAAATAGDPFTQTKMAKKQVDWPKIDDLIATKVRSFHQRLADPKDLIDDIESSLLSSLLFVYHHPIWLFHLSLFIYFFGYVAHLSIFTLPGQCFCSLCKSVSVLP